MKTPYLKYNRILLFFVTLIINLSIEAFGSDKSTRILIKTNADNAYAVINGIPVGDAGKSFKASPGINTITLKAPGYKSRRVKLKTARGKLNKFTVKLVKYQKKPRNSNDNLLEEQRYTPAPIPAPINNMSSSPNQKLPQAGYYPPPPPPGFYNGTGYYAMPYNRSAPPVYQTAPQQQLQPQPQNFLPPVVKEGKGKPKERYGIKKPDYINKPPLKKKKRKKRSEPLLLSKLLPFGIGQLNNEQYIWAAAFAGLEVGALITYFHYDQQASNALITAQEYIATSTSTGSTREEINQYRNEIGDYIQVQEDNSRYSLVAFGGIYLAGVTHAIFFAPSKTKLPSMSKKRKNKKRKKLKKRSKLKTQLMPQDNYRFHPENKFGKVDMKISWGTDVNTKTIMPVFTIRQSF
ncbi:MAG: hypothetical protein CMP10_21460 [Zetaproteobacteria bacterium]|nr:hypothetical protein [Pseudobdellovibrionaceae bacterium]|tara:strand:- start:1130 stop:2347 length:1218 start_codon:yes stop_codon:yes gene_type:complete